MKWPPRSYRCASRPFFASPVASYLPPTYLPASLGQSPTTCLVPRRLPRRRGPIGTWPVCRPSLLEPTRRRRPSCTAVTRASHWSTPSAHPCSTRAQRRHLVRSSSLRRPHYSPARYHLPPSPINAQPSSALRLLLTSRLRLGQPPASPIAFRLPSKTNLRHGQACRPFTGRRLFPRKRMCGRMAHTDPETARLVP